MALSERLNDKTEQQLINDSDFINALVEKLNLANKVNVTGNNATEAGVNAMLGKLTGTDEIIKTGTLPAKVAESAVVNALVPALARGVDDKGIYTKKGVDDAFFRNDGSNTGAIVTALTRDPTFANAVKIGINAEDAGFQSAVRGAMLQPYFDIPADDSTPISAYW